MKGRYIISIIAFVITFLFIFFNSKYKDRKENPVMFFTVTTLSSFIISLIVYFGVLYSKFLLYTDYKTSQLAYNKSNNIL